MAIVRFLLIAMLALSAWGRQESDMPPILKHKQEPEYSEMARNAHIQGNVLLQIVVDKQGIPQDITVLSPLGFGLDENAIEAVSLWRFDPGRKAGQPVQVRATVEVSFRLADERFDSEAEERRGQFNGIVNRLGKANSKPTDKDLRAMEKLADHKSPAANYVVGLWQIEGDAGPKDVTDGWEHIRKSVALHYGPALYYLGHAEMQGEQTPKDEVHGLAHLRQAASAGSNAAQFRLGQMYGKGIGVEASVREAEKYYRLCAASATPECQYELGKLLLTVPKPDRAQAVAWLELADGHGSAEAHELAVAEAAKLLPDQAFAVERLRVALEHRR